LRTPAAGRGPLGGHARARWPPLAGCKPAPATRPAGVRLIHGPGRSRRAAGGGPASRASARREGWHIGRRGQLADVGGHGARVQPAQEGHCGARRMLPLQRSRGRGGDARDGFLGRQALRPPQQPSALPARVLGNGWVHLPAAAPGVALARSRPGPFRHYAQQASLRRARWQAQAQAAHAARTPGRARPEAAHTRLLAHVRRALHKQRPRQRVRGRLHGGCRHHACGHNGALQARAGRAAPAPARAAPVSGRRRRRTRCDVSPSRHAAAAPAEPRSADASRACLLCGRRVACALLATHPHDLHCQAPGVALAGPARLQRAPSVPRPTQVLSSEQLEWATLRGRLYGQHVGCLLTGGRAAQQCRPAGGFAAAGPPLTPTRGMLEA